MNFVLVNRARAKVDGRWLMRFVEQLMEALEKKRVLPAIAEGQGRAGRATRQRQGDDTELVVVFVSEKEMRQINKRYRSKDYATDVLSFTGMDAAVFGGELVLCAPVLRRQAREHGLSFEQELGYMVIHGVLHLLGYEHEQGGRDARQMYQLQDTLFRDLLG